MTLLRRLDTLARVRFFKKIFIEYREAFSLFSRDARFFLYATFLVGIGTNLINLLFSLYLKRLGFDEARIGETLSTRALGMALVALPASFVVARIDAKKLLPSAAALCAAAYAAQTFALAGAGLSASVLLSGAVSTVFQIAGGPFLMRHSGERERVHLFSLNGALAFGTGVIGSLLAGLAKDGLAAIVGDEILAYRVSMLVGALIVLSSVIPFSRIASDKTTTGRLSPGKAGSDKASSLNAIAVDGNLATRDPAADVASRHGTASEAAASSASRETPKEPGLALYVKILIPGFLVGTGAGLTIPYLNIYFKNSFALSDTAIGAAVAAGQVFTFLGITAGPAIARRLGPRMTIVLSQGISVPFILVLAYIHSLPLALAAYFARQAFMNMSTPLQDAFALGLVPEKRRHLMNALKMTLWTGSWMIAARISGSLIAVRGFAPSFFLTAVLYAVSTLLFALFFLRKNAA